MLLEPSERRIVQTALQRIGMDHAAQRLAQVHVERTEGRPVEHQIDKLAASLIAGCSGLLAAGLAHIGAASDLAVDQADPFRLAISARDRAYSDIEGVRQRTLGRKLSSGLEMALAHIVLQRIDDGPI